MNKLVKTFFALLLVAGCSPKAEVETLSIETANGKVTYTIEEANTREEQERGLMDRTSLEADHGMIFNITPVRRVAMWMKDTKFPLDMVFIDENGMIIQTYENAEAMSEYKIVSNVPVRAVIEINAGDIKKHNIQAGQKVDFKYFQKQETKQEVKTEAKQEQK